MDDDVVDLYLTSLLAPSPHHRARGEPGQSKSDRPGRYTPSTGRRVRHRQRVDAQALVGSCGPGGRGARLHRQFTVRQAVNAATVNARPLVAQRRDHFDGQISVTTRRGDTPCYACLFPADYPVRLVI